MRQGHRPSDSGTDMDEQYYEVAAPRSLGERLAVVARDRIYADILRLLPAGAATTQSSMSGSPTSSTTPPTCWSGNIRTRTASRPRVWARASAFEAAYPKVSLPADRGQPAAAVRRPELRYRGVQCGAGACRQRAAPGGVRRANCRGWPNGSSSACRTGIFRSSITPRSRCCISGPELRAGLPAGSARRTGRTKRNLILMSRQRLAVAGACGSRAR